MKSFAINLRFLFFLSAMWIQDKHWIWYMKSLAINLDFLFFLSTMWIQDKHEGYMDTPKHFRILTFITKYRRRTTYILL
jgi:hypothetical protein